MPPRSVASRWATRVILLGVALANIQCLGDFVPPEAPVYDFETADSTITVAAGDVVSLPTIQLKVNGKVQTTGLRVEVVGVTDVITVDTSTNRVAILKTGTATVRVRPVNSGLATDTLHLEITLTAIAPKAAISGPDTAYSIGDTLKQVGRATTKADITLPGVPVTWSVVPPDSGVATFLQIGDTARLIALKVGDITLRAQVDTGWITKTVRVRQQVARIVVSPPGDSATPSKPTATFTAAAYDAKNTIIPGAPINWVSLNTNIATINGQGVVTRVNTGQTAVVAQSGSVNGYGLVSVVVPVAAPVNLWAPMTSNTTTQLNDVFGTSTSNVFAVGNGGVVRRWNGTSWTTHTNSSTDNLSAVWSQSVLTYAVGANGTLRQFDGATTWNAVSSGTTANLLSIWSGAPNAVFLGGESRISSNATGAFVTQVQAGSVAGIWGTSAISAVAVTSTSQATLNYNGTNWSTGATLPGVGPMNGVWGLSATQMYAVGGGNVRTFAGSTWVTTPVGDASKTMYDAWGSGPNDMYLVGSSGAIARQSGASWVLENAGVSATLRGIWGFGNDVFVVGDGGTILRGYRGATVTVAQPSPITTKGGTTQLTPTTRDASSNTITLSSHTWSSGDTAVATVNSTGLVTARRNGTAQVCATAPGGAQGCTSVTVNVPVGPVVTVTVTPPGASIGTGSTTFTAVARDADSNVVTGKTFTWASSNPGVATAAGATLTAQESGQTTVSATVDNVTGYAVLTVATPSVPAVNLWVSENSGTTQPLRAVWGTGPSLVYAVGDAGVIRVNTGTGWGSSNPSLTTNLDGIWGSASNDVFVGVAMLASPRIIRHDGGAWSTSLSTGPGPGGISGIWGVSPKEVYASESGGVYRFNGTTWTSTGVGFQPPQPVYHLWGTSTNDVWAVGNGGLVSRWNGSDWETVPHGVPAFEGLGVWGTGPSDVFVVGDSTALRWNGSAFASIKSGLPAGVDLTGVSGTSGTDVYASSRNGTFRFNGTAWTQTDVLTEAYWGIHALRNGDVILVGDNGAIRRGLRGATVTVDKANASDDFALNTSETLQLAAVAKNSTGATVSGVTGYAWTTRDVQVASVNASGLVTAGTKADTVSICATAPGGALGCKVITVNAVAGPIATITVSPSGAAITGGTMTFTAIARDANDLVVTGATFDWASTNSAVATVPTGITASGVATAVASGQTAISAKANGVTGYALLTVAMPGATPVNLWVSDNSGTSATLRSVWGPEASTVFAVGDGGVTRRYQSGTWSGISSGVSVMLDGLWGTSSSDVFAGVGESPARVLRFDGASWSSTGLSQPSSGGTSAITGVWAASPREVYATHQGSIRKYDGSSWTSLAAGSSEQLFEVWGSSRDDIWVVGYSGNVIRWNGTSGTELAAGGAQHDAWGIWGAGPNEVYIAGNSTALRWNGTALQSIATGLPANAGISGLWGSSGSDLYASSKNGRTWRFNGTSWAVTDSQPGFAMYGVWGTSAGDVLVVGQGGAIRRGIRGATITVAPANQAEDLALNASEALLLSAVAKNSSGATVAGATFTWTSSVPAVATVTANGDVNGLTNGSANICATAPGGAQGCVMVTVGPVLTSIVVLPIGVTITGGNTTLTATPKDQNGNTMTGVAVTWTSLNPAVATVNSSGVVTAVSSGQATITASSGSVSWPALVTVAIPGAVPVNLWRQLDLGTTAHLRSIWGPSSSDHFVGAFGGTILRYNGSTWSPMTSGTTAELLGVWGTSGSRVYAVGTGGAFLRFNGTSWSTIPTSGFASNDHLRDVWGNSDGVVFAVGDGGRILFSDGTTAGSMNSGTTEHLRAVYGFSGSDVFAVGGVGTILKYNGVSWSPMNSGTTEHLYDIWGTSPSDIYAVGANGRILHYDGSSWSTVATGGAENLLRVWGTSSSDIYAMGGVNDGVTTTLRRFNGTSWSTLTYPGTLPPEGLWGTSGSSVFATAPNGQFFEGIRGATITIAPTSVSLTTLGSTQQLTATIKDASNNTITGPSLTWTSSNAAAATVSSSGLVTAIANGTTSVCATAPGGVQGCTSTTVGPASITVSPGGVSLTGGSSTLTAIGKDAGGTTIPNISFVWASLNPSVATVNSSTGVVTAVSSGQAVISATVGSVTGYGVVTVAISGAPPVNLWAPMATGTSENLRGLWGSSASNIHAVGGAGTALRFDGATWTPTSPPTGHGLNGVWGTSASNVYAVGGDELILRYNGSSWSPIHSRPGDTYTGVWGVAPDSMIMTGVCWIYRFTRASGSGASLGERSSFCSEGAWGASADSIFVVGRTALTPQGFPTSPIYHYAPGAPNGPWLPMTAAAATDLYGVWGTSSTSVFAVGSSIEYFNGSSWISLGSPGVMLYGVWGSATTDIYAVGAAGTILRSANGSTFVPVTSGTATTLRSVWGTTTGDVYVAGDGGTILRGVRGATLTVAPTSPTLTALGQTQQLTPTAKDASNNTIAGVAFAWSSATPSVATVNASGLVTAVAVGSTSVCATAPGGAQGCTTVTVTQAANSVVVLPTSGALLVTGTTTLSATAYDASASAISGATFTWASLNTGVATINSSTGQITPVRSGQVAISATSGGITGYATLTVAVPSASPVNLWVPTSSPVDIEERIVGFWGETSSSVFALADWNNGLRHRIVKWDGATWTQWQFGLSTEYYSLWGASPNDIVAVGYPAGEGTRYNGTNWAGFNTGVSAQLEEVWQANPRATFVATNDGKILKYDGSTWSSTTVSSGNSGTSLWGTSDRAAYATFGTSSSTLFKYNGSSWTQIGGTSALLVSAWGIADTAIFFGGLSGGSSALYRWNGSSFVSQTHPNVGNIYFIWGSSLSDIYAVGNSGKILRYDGSSWTLMAGSATTDHLHSVWGTSNGDVFVGGSAGTILRGVRGASVTVTPASPTLTAFGATEQLSAAVKDAGNNAVSGATISWSSATPSVATVNASGLVTAIANGTSSVCATAPGGVQGCTTVTVSQAVASVTVSPSGASLSSGTTTISGTAKDANNNTVSGATFTWTSLNTAVATVNSSTGVVSPVSSGQAAISATAGGVTAYSLITVSVPGASAVNLFARETTPGGSLREIWGANSGAVWAVGSDGPTTGAQGVMVHYNGTSWSNATLTANPGLNDVAGVSASDAWAVGEGGLLWRWNGSAWSAATSPTSDQFFSVWASGPTDVWAVTINTNKVFRYNGSTWAEVAHPISAGGSKRLRAIWGSAANDVWIVGEGGALMRWNGTSFSEVTSPAGAEHLYDVWGSGPNDVWAVGGTQNVNPVIMRYNGSTWSVTSRPGGTDLLAVWGNGPNEVWAAGSYGLLLRYNGSAWSVADSAGVTRGHLHSMWGMAPGTMYASADSGIVVRGYRGASVSVSPLTPTLTAFGATQQMTPVATDASNNTINGVTFAWSSATPSVATVNASGLVTAAANGTSSVCATAPGGVQACTTITVAQAAASITVSPDGATITSGTTTFTATAKDANNNTIAGQTFTWASLNTNVATVNSSSGVVTPVASGQVAISASANGVTSYGLLTVAIPSTTPVNLWASIASGTTTALTGGMLGFSSSDVYLVEGVTQNVLRFNGGSWSNIATGAAFGLNALWGAQSSDLWVTGNGGQMLHYNGSWTPVATGLGVDLLPVWGASPTDVFVAGSAGVIGRYNGSSWSAMTSGTSAAFAGMWGFSRDNVFAVAAENVRRFDGTQWTSSFAPASVSLYGIWGSGPNDVYAVGCDFPGGPSAPGRIYRFNGSSWSLVASTAAGKCVVRVWGTSSSEVYAAGDAGLLMRFDGSSWTTLNSGTSETLRGVWTTTNADVHVAGTAGTILRGVRGATVTVTPASPTLTAIGATQQLTPTAKDASNNTISGVTFTWSSSDDTKATVSSSGLVTAVANGTANVCATAPGGVQGCTTTTVAQAAASITVSPDGASITSGTTTFTAGAKDANGNTISGATFTWASLNTNVATVNSSTGVVSAVSSGQAVITVSANGVTAYALVTVAVAGATPVNLWAPMTSGTAATLTGVWGTSATDVWAVGNATILHYNGTAWSSVTSPAGDVIWDVFGLSASEVYATTQDNKVLRYNGSQWSVFATLADDRLWKIWAASPRDIYVVSASTGKVWRYDGSQWTHVTTSGSGGLWGSSASDVHAAGASLRRYNGSTWATLSNPLAQGYSAVWGSGSGSVFALGESGGVARYNGTAWVDNGSSIAGVLPYVSVWGSSASDIYAVSGYNSGQPGSIMRYNGTAWTSIPNPSGQELWGVWGTREGDVFATGVGGTILRGVRGATVTVTPGSPTLTALGATQQITPTAKDASNNTISGVTGYTWSSATPSVATVNTSGLVTAVANGTSEVCATAPGGAQGCTTVTVAQAVASVSVSPAGATITSGAVTFTATARDANNNTISGATFTWSSLSINASVNSSGVVSGLSSGQATIKATSGAFSGYAVATVAISGAAAINLWTKTTLPVTSFSDVWAATSTDVHAVGSAGQIYRYNGTNWTSETSGTSSVFYAIWGTSATDIFATTGEASFRFGGTNWSSMANPAAEGFDLWGSSPNDVFAVGSVGRINRFNGTSWTQTTVGSSQWDGVWGSSASDVFAVGQNGTIAHFDGTAWSTMTSGTSVMLTAVWGTSPTNVYAVGESGTILHYDGSSWSAMTSGSSGYLQAIWGSSNSDIYAAGNNSELLRYNGSTWSTLSSGASAHLLGMVGVGYDLFVGGSSGTILRGVRGATVAVTPASPTLTAFGNTVQLSATATDLSDQTIIGATFTWSSGTPGVATVNSSGLVTAVANGTSSVCATATGGAQGCTTVTVAQATASVVVSPTGASISGGTATFTATAKDANGNAIVGKTFTWTSLNPSVATVGSSTGTVAPVTSGQASIAASVDGVTAYSVATVAVSGTTPANLWKHMTSPTGQTFWDAWVADSANVWAVGYKGVIAHYDGTAWSRVDSGSTSDAFYSVWGTSPSNVWAVGSIVRRFNGTTWTTDTTLSGTFVGLWGVSPTEVYAVELKEPKNYLVRYDGSSWTRIDSVTVTGGAWALWGTARDNILMAHATQTIYRWDGSSRSTVHSGVNVVDITGTSALDMFAAVQGGGSSLKSSDGGANWQSLPAAPSAAECCYSFWAASPTEVWGVVNSGGYRIARYSGTAWDTVNVGSPSVAVMRITGTSNGAVWAFGSAGQIIRGYRGGSVTVSPSSPYFAVGGSATLTATAKDAQNNSLTGVNFSWSSSNTSVATVNSSGVVTAIATGSATITARAPGGASGTATVTVAAVSTVSLSPDGAALTGGTQTFTATAKDVSDNTLTTGAFTFASTNTNVATINSSGVAQCAASGQASVSATVSSKTAHAVVTCALAGATAVNLWAPLTSGTTEELRGLWGVSTSNVFAVGANGKILRYNGSTWSTMTSNTTAYLKAVWGTTTSDVFAVGNGGVIRRYNGSSWSGMTSNSTVDFQSVWGASGVNVFAGGSVGVVDRYNGTAWGETNLGDGSTTYTLWGSSGSDVFAAGTAPVWRFNGTSWGALNNSLVNYGLWGASGSSIYAVGDVGAIARYNGSTWNSMTSSVSTALQGVWGSSDADIYAVGAAGTIVRYNGTSWSSQTSGTSQNLFAVWGAPNSDVFAAGASGTILRGYRGATVLLAPASPTLISAGATQQLTAAAKDASNNTVSAATFTWSSGTPSVATVNSSGLVTAVADGTSSVCATAPGGVQGCTTVTVAIVASIDVSPGSLVFTSGSTTFSATAKTAGGSTIPGVSFAWSSLNPSVATINSSSGAATVVANGQTAIAASAAGVTGYALLTVDLAPTQAMNLWVAEASGTSAQLNDAWGPNADTVYIVGTGGTIRRRTASSWSSMTSGTSEHLDGVWGFSGTNVFAVGENGTIARYNGTSWSTMSSSTSAKLLAVWGASPTDIFAVGVNGTILRFNGSAWSAMTSNTSEHLSGVWGSSASNVFAVGANGTIMRYNGSTWTSMTSNTSEFLHDVWGVGVDVFAGGEAGVHRYNGSTWNVLTGGTGTHSGLWATTTSEAFVVGSAGTFKKYNGTTFDNSIASGVVTTEDMFGVWAAPVDLGVAVGVNGTVIRGVRGATVSLSPSSPTIGGSQQMTLIVKDANNNTVPGVGHSWQSSNTSVATVDGSGLVTAVANGTTIVCALPRGTTMQACTTVTVDGVTFNVAHSMSVNSSASSTALSSINITGTNRLLVCGMSMTPRTSPPSVTSFVLDDGSGGGAQALTQLGSNFSAPSDGNSWSVWYLTGATVSSNRRVMVTLSAQASFIGLSCISYNGVHQTSPFGTATTANGTSGSASHSITSTVDGGVPWALLLATNSGYADGAGTVTRRIMLGPNNASMVDGNLKLLSGNSHTFNWLYTTTGGQWGAQAAVIRPANP